MEMLLGWAFQDKPAGFLWHRVLLCCFACFPDKLAAEQPQKNASLLCHVKGWLQLRKKL
jgi:hypothetical protein